MRIGQLARRLGIVPSDIVGFLGNQDIDSNSRLTNEDVVNIINRFAPEKLSDIMTSPTEEKPVEEKTAEEKVEQTVVEETVIEETKSSSLPIFEEQKQTTEETPTELEVIRVSKVELQGLKVLGKIDLPAPKKKAEPTEQPEPQANQQPRKEFQRRNDRRDREWKNPLEMKRQQEARENERRKKENAEKQKERRTSHYYNKVKSVPTKAVRRFDEQTIVEDVEIKTPPKGLIGRFLYWLRN